MRDHQWVKRHSQMTRWDCKRCGARMECLIDMSRGTPPGLSLSSFGVDPDCNVQIAKKVMGS